MKTLIRAVALFSLLVPAAAQAAWHEASSSHFQVYAEGSAESVREMATRLERFDKGMRVLHNLPDLDNGPANRVTVYVVHNVEEIERLAGGRDGVRGFYIGRAAGPVAFIPRRAGSGLLGELNSETILFHEYSHHFMLQNYTGAYPAWFVEGFAEFNATARFDKDGSVGFGIPAFHRQREIANAAGTVGDLFATTDAKRIRPDALYGRGWLLTHYLTFEPSRRGQLKAYLTALNEGRPSLEAARSAFGDFDKLEFQLRDYFEKRRLSYIDIGPAALPIGPVTVRQLGAGETAVIRLKMKSDRGIPPERALPLALDMRKAAAPYPNDPAVQAALAEAEYDAGNLAEAEAAADRAIAAQPTNLDALVYKARVALAKAARDKSPAAWKAARHQIAAANRADPNAPEPLILFHRAFLDQGIAPTRNAVTGLLRALELAPQDKNLRLTVGRQHLVDGYGAGARAVLEPLAFDPHGGERARAMQTILAALDAKGAEAALALWEKEREAEGDRARSMISRIRAGDPRAGSCSPTALSACYSNSKMRRM